MKETISNIFKWFGCLLLIICGIICCLGLVLALVGSVFNNDSLYFIDLLLASPLYLFVLPGLIVLLVLFNLFNIVSMFRKPCTDDKNKKIKQDKKGCRKEVCFYFFFVLNKYFINDHKPANL